MVVYAGADYEIGISGLDLAGLAIKDRTCYTADTFYEHIVVVDLDSPEAVSTVAAPGVDGDVSVGGDRILYCVGDQVHQATRTGEAVVKPFAPRPGHRITGLHLGEAGIYLAYAELGVLDVRETDDLEQVVACHTLNEGLRGLTLIGEAVALGCVPETGLVHMLNLDTESRFDVSAYGKPTGVAWDGERVWLIDGATFQLRRLQLPAQPSPGIKLKP